jgi:hypothetical protein
MRPRLMAAVAALAVTLGACSDIYYDRRDTIALSAGDAIAANTVVQMVDPWPPHSGNKNIPFNGEKMQSAVERYRTNKVTPPPDPTTSDILQSPAVPTAMTSQTNTQTNGPGGPTASTSTSTTSTQFGQ